MRTSSEEHGTYGSRQRLSSVLQFYGRKNRMEQKLCKQGMFVNIVMKNSSEVFVHTQNSEQK